MRLHRGQKRALKTMHHAPVKYNIIKSSRQAGKTAFAIYLLTGKSTENKNQKCLWASPTISQAFKVFAAVKKTFPKKLIRKTNETRREIELINNTIIQFIGVEKPDNIRGDNTDLFILDEFAFYKPTVWPILKPFLLTKKNAQCIIISTPRGMQGDFYKMFQRGLENDGRYRSYEWNYHDNPYCDLEEIEDAKQALPIDMFRQEYLGEFVKDGSSVFSNVDLCSNVTKFQEYNPVLRYYNGNDLAKQKDFTVSTTLNEKCQVANIYRTRHENWELIVDNIVNQISTYNPELSLMEVNGVGDPVYDMTSNKLNNNEKFHGALMPWIASNSSKEEIISRLVHSFNLKNISIPTQELAPTLHEQLNTFTFTYSKVKRQIVYHAIEGYHDDDVMSLALAHSAWYRFHGRR